MKLNRDSDVGLVLFFLRYESLMCLLIVTGILGYQSYVWLRTGQWVPISIVSLLGYLGFEWAVAPDDWLGVHRVLGSIPLSLAVFLFTLPSIVLLVLYHREQR
jgi:hypothetical protein